MISRLIELVSYALSRAFDESEADWWEVRDELADQLESRGFEPEEIQIALDVAGRIRESLESQPVLAENLKSNQLYRLLEEWKLSPEARGYLISIQENGSLTPEQRETVVERCLSLDTIEPVGLELMRGLVNWVVSGEEDDLDSFLTDTVH